MKSKTKGRILVDMSGHSIVGVGIYSISEASRITGVPWNTMKRWTRGYSFRRAGELVDFPPIIAMDIGFINGGPTLSFRDLMEVRFLNAFRKHGVSSRAIRIASRRACEILQTTHPFSTKKFKTDGKTILTQFVDETGDDVLLDLVKNQFVFSRIVSRYLYGGIEYNDYDELLRWYPLGKNRNIVIDPARNFGAPIIAQYGIPTKILMQAYTGSKSYKAVAKWYRIDEFSVRDAVRYERTLVIAA